MPNSASVCRVSRVKREIAEASRQQGVLEIQQGGSHYKGCGIEPVTYSLANNLGGIEFEVVKYITRHGKKGGVEGGITDLKKVIHYTQILLQEFYGVRSTFNVIEVEKAKQKQKHEKHDTDKQFGDTAKRRSVRNKVSSTGRQSAPKRKPSNNT